MGNSGINNDFYSNIEKINQIIDALGEFEGKFDKKFNLSKLARYLSLNEQEIDTIINLIFNFQTKFESVFNKHRIIRKVIEGQIYFTLEKREIKIPKEILINTNQLNQLCDIIYLFQYIQKGKGFNLQTNNTELLNNLNKLRSKHPYLFLEEDDDIIYPSELGIELGNLIRSYNKSNQEVKKIEINKLIFIVD